MWDQTGDEVVLLYDMVTQHPGRDQLICEWHGGRGRQDRTDRVVFDSAPFGFPRSG